MYYWVGESSCWETFAVLAHSNCSCHECQAAIEAGKTYISVRSASGCGSEEIPTCLNCNSDWEEVLKSFRKQGSKYPHARWIPGKLAEAARSAYRLHLLTDESQAAIRWVDLQKDVAVPTAQMTFGEMLA